MKKTPSPDDTMASSEMPEEYSLDYTKAKPNRFAPTIPEGGRMVILDPDVAQVLPLPKLSMPCCGH